MLRATLGRISAVLLALLLVWGLVGPVWVNPAQAAAPLTEQTEAVDQAITWLRTQQQEDGSFSSSEGITLDAVFAGVAAGEDVSTWVTGTTNLSPLDYLATQVITYTKASAGSAGKLLAGVVAAGEDPNDFGGLDLVTRVLSYTQAYTQPGKFDEQAINQSWAILGLAAAREAPPSGAATELINLQESDGGWGWKPWGSDPDTTAMAVQALVAAGESVTSTVILSATSYLSSTQLGTGGFGGWGSLSASSTAYAIQALVATGQNPLSAAWCKNGRSPLDDLLDLQLASGGFKGWTGTEDIMSTAQAIPGVLGKPFPFAGVAPAIGDALAYLRGEQEADGSFSTGFGANLSPSTHALLALASAGEDARQWKGGSGASLVGYLASAASSIDNAGVAGRLAAALALARENPYLLGDVNLLAVIQAYYDPGSGSYDAYSNIWNHALALWGLAACGESIPGEAVTWLTNQQNGDGGWGWAAGQNSDSNSTALVAQALVGSGVSLTSTAIISATAYMHTQQVADGGFAYDVAPGAESDANSTACAIQGILAAGTDPASGWDSAQALTGTDQLTLTVHKPMDRLLAYQLESGAFEWKSGNGANFLATVQAIPPLARVTFPQESSTILAAKKATQWIKTQQQDNGSFPSAFGSPAGMTLDAVFAGVAVGEDPSPWKTAGGNPTVMDYLATAVVSYTTDAAQTGKFVTGLVAAGEDPTSFGGHNLLYELQCFDDGAGSFGSSATEQAWAIIGLASTQTPVRQAVVDALTALQQSDGGWESGPGWGTDSNTTALALQALAASGLSPTSTAVISATAYLRTQQASDGGFAYSTAWGTDADANSTAYALQGLLAAGESPFSAGWLVDGTSPLDALLSFQTADGAFEWKPAQGENLLATVQAVPAMLLEPNPLRTSQIGVAPPPIRLSLPLVFTS